MTADPSPPTPEPRPDGQPESTAPEQGGAGVPAGGRARRTRLIAWAVAVGAFALFALFGSVPIEVGSEAGTGVGVVEEWRALGRDLPGVGHATLLRVLFYGSLALVVLGGAAGLWLALSVEPAEAEPEPGDGAGSA
jgi:hypothetical protein